MPDERRPRSPTETHYPNLDVFEMTRKSWNTFKYLFVQNYEFRTRMMENVTPVDLNVLSWTFGVELSNHEKQTYLTPIRMMPGIQQWLTTKIDSRHNVMLVGDDVNRLVCTVLSRKMSVVLRMIREPFSFLLVVTSVIESPAGLNSRDMYSISLMGNIPRSMVRSVVKDINTKYLSLETYTNPPPFLKRISDRKRPDMVIVGTDMVESMEWNWGVNVGKYVSRISGQVTGISEYPIMNQSTYMHVMGNTTRDPCILRLLKNGRYGLLNGEFTIDAEVMEEADQNSNTLMMQLPGVPTIRAMSEFVMMIPCTIMDED